MPENTEIATIEQRQPPNGREWIRRWIDTPDSDGAKINRFRIMAGPHAKRAKQFAEIKVGPSDTYQTITSRVHKNANNTRQRYVCVHALYSGSRFPADSLEWEELEDPDLDEDLDEGKQSSAVMREMSRMFTTQVAHNQFLIGQAASQTTQLVSMVQKDNERMSAERGELEKARVALWEAAEDLEDRRAERDRKAKQTEALINGASNIGQSVLMYLARGKAGNNNGTSNASSEASSDEHPSTKALGQLLSTLDEEQAGKLIALLRPDQQTLFLTMVQKADYPEDKKKATEAEVVECQEEPKAAT